MENIEKHLADTVKNLNAEIAEKQNAIDAKLDLMSSNVEKGEEFKNELKGEMKELLAKHEQVQKQADALATELKRNQHIMKSEDRTFKSELVSTMNDNMARYKSMINRETAGLAFEIDQTKAVTEAGNLTDEVIQPDYIPGIVYDPERTERIRNYISQGVTSSDQVVYNQETGYTDNTGMTAENDSPTENSFTLERKEAPVRKIMSLMTISNEMLEDLPQVISYISTRGIEKLLNLEDTQILTGNGTGQNLTGINQVATTFAPGLTVEDAQRWDVLRFAIAQLRTQAGAEYRANGILLHPNDLAEMDTTKDSTGEYVFPGLMMVNGQRSLYGVPVFDTTAVAEGAFYVGDWRLGAQLFQRRGVSVEFSRENDFAKDNTVVKITERLALPIYRPKAFVYGSSFSDAIAEISAT